MKRRTLLKSALLTSPLILTGTAALGKSPLAKRELYEFRTYTIRFRGNLNLLLAYLREALTPALNNLGVKEVHIFRESGEAEPIMLHVLIAYPDANTYVEAQQLAADPEFLQASAEYDAVPVTSPIYTQFTSSLYLAFEGMPNMNAPRKRDTLFELRTYQGATEASNRRKIRMFNVEELELFDKVGLKAVFFGEMIAGPYRPCLTYLLAFKNREERDENWEKFLQHPDWNRMKNAPEYADSLSNIQRTFLKRA